MNKINKEYLETLTPDMVVDLFCRYCDYVTFSRGYETYGGESRHSILETHELIRNYIVTKLEK